jgi:hypothetical protein
MRVLVMDREDISLHRGRATPPEYPNLALCRLEMIKKNWRFVARRVLMVQRRFPTAVAVTYVPACPPKTEAVPAPKMEVAPAPKMEAAPAMWGRTRPPLPARRPSCRCSATNKGQTLGFSVAHGPRRSRVFPSAFPSPPPTATSASVGLLLAPPSPLQPPRHFHASPSSKFIRPPSPTLSLH